MSRSLRDLAFLASCTSLAIDTPSLTFLVTKLLFRKVSRISGSSEKFFRNIQRASGRTLLPETFRKKWLFRKVLPEYSKGIRKNPSSENFLEELLLPEVLEEAFAVLPEDATVTTPFSIFSGVFYPKVPLS